MEFDEDASFLVTGVPVKTRYSPFGETDSVIFDIKNIHFVLKDDDVGNTICCFFSIFFDNA